VRILRVASVPNNRTGGMSRVMHFTGDALRRLGHHVDYLFREDMGPAVRPRLERFVLPCRLPGLVRRKQAEAGPFDVVEIHEPLTAYYCFARRFDPNLPPPVAITYGIEARSRRAILAYKRAKELRVSLKQRYSPLSVVWQANYGLRRCTAVICFNEEDAAFLEKAGLPSGRVFCSHSGVSDAFLAAGSAATPVPGCHPGILFLGTWLERKGILDLVPAVRRVLLESPAARLTVAGCGCQESTVRQSFSTELQHRIEVLPRIDADHDLLQVFRRHSVFVLPSIFEGQPLSMLEAAALGLAIVTTDVCGMRDFILHGEDGLLVRPGDADGLAACLMRLVRDEAETRRLGQAARRKVQDFTWENAAVKMLAAYEAAAFPVRPFDSRNAPSIVGADR